MKDLFEAIASLFDQLLFLPYQILTEIESFSWWAANGVSFIFLTIGAIAGVYWINQLRSFDKKGEEKKDCTAHSFL
ncbi:MAG: uracil phosphoribosyltransferase [Flavobacteriaceae bacterium]|nr:uracil phosphoribosyltransferase [Flavobacteriaceae bacterium]|tara:strand:+ start:68 stop:295 length:228 start_codon:yes stop_codon:yes gene_type:complete